VLFLALAALYVLAPGHPALPFAGIPIGQSGVAALVVIALLSGAIKRRRVPLMAVAAMLALVVSKAAIAALVPEPGWLARYYANAAFDGPAERSIDYRSLPATRIDRTLAFADTSFPVHFFNDRRFDRGFRREYTDPLSAQWTGYIDVAGETAIQMVLRARGTAVLSLDGREIARIEGADARETPLAATLPAGAHVLEARYSKPANTEGVFELRGATPADDAMLMRVMPRPDREPPAATDALQVIALLLHVATLALLIRISAPAARAWLAEVREAASDRSTALLRLFEPALVIGLTAQGLWKSRHLVGHVWTLTGGDDWMTFEHNARDVLLNGVLMTEGQPLGAGRAYFAYPGYTYFIALVHAVVGESLAGVVLMNFVMLALASVFVLRLARVLVPPPAAVLAVVWLVALQQAAFVRYYTVTLLSENLFVATSAGAVLGFTRYVIERRATRAWEGGAWGGASAVTRPSMMLFLPLVLGVVTWAGWTRGRRARAVVAATAAFAAWMAVVAPFTLRNYLVSGEPVLISSGQAKSFIDYSMPPENQMFYLDMYDGSLTSAGIVLARMLVDQPRAFLGGVGHKVGFALGMVHWAEGVSLHPELLMTSVLYVVAIFVVPAARSLAAMPLHLFVITHLMALTLSLPWNYGYRMILPMYPLMSVFAMAVPARVFLAVRFEPHARAT
jgi:hypothetical protein